MASCAARRIRRTGFPGSAFALLVLMHFTAAAFAGEPGYRVYVTNEGSGDLTVIDGLSYSVLNTLPLGKRPRGIVAAADGRQLFVALSGSPLARPGVDERLLPPADKTADGIGVVDVASGRIDRVLQGVSDPEQLAISGNGSRLYVASEDTGKAIVIDPLLNAVVARLDVGGEPEGVAVNPASDLVCVTSESDNTVTLIDTRHEAVLQRIAVGLRPRDAVFSPDGSVLYVPGESDRSLTVIDVKSRKVVKTLRVPGEGALPKGVAVSRDGLRVYVTTGRGGHVVAYDARTFSVIAIVAVGARPWGVALSPDSDYLYTANGPSNDVTIIDTRTMTVVATVKAGDRPWGIGIVRLAAR